MTLDDALVMFFKDTDVLVFTTLYTDDPQGYDIYDPWQVEYENEYLVALGYSPYCCPECQEYADEQDNPYSDWEHMYP